MDLGENVRMVIAIREDGDVTVHDKDGNTLNPDSITLQQQMKAISENEPIMEKKIFSVIPCTIMITNPCYYYWIGNYRYEYCYPP